MAFYAERLARLGSEVESRWVKTELGSVHVLVSGPLGGPPLVLLHGAASSAVDLADTFGWIGQGYRRYYVDLPGEPNRSTEVRPSKSGQGYGLWMRDVLDGLGVGRVSMFGVSLGGFVALKSATVIPERLARIALLVPEGLARPRWLPLLRAVMWPAIRYGLTRSQAHAHRFVRSLAAPDAPIPRAFLEQMVQFMKHVTHPASPGPPFRAADLRNLQAPVLIVAGGKDVLFPGDRVVRRAQAVIPSLEEAVLVPDAGHVHFVRPDDHAGQRVQVFLAEERGKATSATSPD
jgi:pimeloyl-ACP methyl ester carboxylesterase